MIDLSARKAAVRPSRADQMAMPNVLKPWSERDAPPPAGDVLVVDADFVTCTNWPHGFVGKHLVQKALDVFHKKNDGVRVELRVTRRPYSWAGDDRTVEQGKIRYGGEEFNKDKGYNKEGEDMRRKWREENIDGYQEVSGTAAALSQHSTFLYKHDSTIPTAPQITAGSTGMFSERLLVFTGAFSRRTLISY